MIFVWLGYALLLAFLLGSAGLAIGVACYAAVLIASSLHRRTGFRILTAASIGAAVVLGLFAVAAVVLGAQLHSVRPLVFIGWGVVGFAWSGALVIALHVITGRRVSRDSSI